MIVACLENSHQLDERMVKRLSARLPVRQRDRLLRYRRWQDRQAGLFGKLLLVWVFNRLSGDDANLETVELDAYQRPYLRDVANVDFNISHTEGMVVCAAEAGTGRVGIDVENLKEIELSEFRRVFTPEEYAYLRQLPDPKEEFHRLWTRKEAVMKADGRGFHLDPARIDCLGDTIAISGITYQVRPLDVSDGIACHVAGPSVATISMHHVGIDDLIKSYTR